MTDDGGFLSDGWAMVVGLVVLLAGFVIAALALGRLERWEAEKTRSEALRKLMGAAGHERAR